MSKVVFVNKGTKFGGELIAPRNATSVVVYAPGFGADYLDMTGSGKIALALSRTLAKKGIASLRFNYRFITPKLRSFYKITMDGEVDDLKSVIDYASRRFENVALLGESFGGEICTLAKNDRVRCIAFWYTPFGPVPGSVIRQMRKGHPYAYKRTKMIYYRVGEKLISQMRSFKPKQHFSKVTCPALILHGTADKVVPIACAHSINASVRGPKKLVVVKGMNHTYKKDDGKTFNERHLAYGVKLTADWFAKTLKA